MFNQFGDLERCALRPGNVYSADGWGHVPKPVIACCRGTMARIVFRDAAVAQPNMYELLEAEGVEYAIPITWVGEPQERCALMTSQAGLWCPPGRSGLHLLPNPRSGMPEPRELPESSGVGSKGTVIWGILAYVPRVASVGHRRAAQAFAQRDPACTDRRGMGA